MADPTNLTLELANLQNELSTLTKNMTENNNAFFLVTMALIIFLMQCGFAFLGIAILSYWAIGWAFAWGHNDNAFGAKFIGSSDFFLYGMHDYPRFFFQFVFAATAATIVAGAVAERCKFAAYILYCTCISSVIYPIIVHWGWNEQGWMFAGVTIDGMHVKYVDFAGSGMVHLCGGTISFVAAYIMGPRIGRFPKNDDPSPELQGHSVPFAALGGFILMFCFLAFNGGSQADIVRAGSGNIVALAMINTIMSGASAAFTTLIFHYIGSKKLTLLLTINACLAGMVAACAGANQMKPVSSAVIGLLAATFYMSLSSGLLKLKVDDPLEATGVHAGGGFAGLLGASLFMDTGVVYGLYQWASQGDTHSIKFASLQLGWTLICALAIILWSFSAGFFVFGMLKTFGLLRVSEEVEVKGLDIYMHGEASYPLHAYGHGWDEFESVKYLNNNPPPHSRKISTNQELSLEELAAAYEHRTTPKERKISLYRNPLLYEHPEHHHKALQGNVFSKRNQIRPIKEPINETIEDGWNGQHRNGHYNHNDHPIHSNPASIHSEKYNTDGNDQPTQYDRINAVFANGSAFETLPKGCQSTSPNGRSSSFDRQSVPDSPTHHVTIVGCPAVPINNHSINIQPIDYSIPHPDY